MATNAVNYPVGPVRLIVPFPTGGSTEFTAQMLAEQLSDIFGQPFGIENRIGDFGIKAMNDKEITATFANVGARIATSGSPEQFAAEIAAEMEQWEKVIAEIKLVVE